jgi:hypothetical protein
VSSSRCCRPDPPEEEHSDVAPTRESPPRRAGLEIRRLVDHNAAAHSRLPISELSAPVLLRRTCERGLVVRHQYSAGYDSPLPALPLEGRGSGWG